LHQLRRPLARPALLFTLAAMLVVLTACGSRITNTNWAGLSTDGQKVYLAFGPRVLAYDPATQTQAWLYPAENSAVNYFAAPAAENGRVIIGDYGRAGGFFSPRVTITLHGLQENGNSVSELWANTDASDKIVAPPLQVGDQLFVGTADNHVLALNATNGTLLWDFETDHAIWGQPALRDGTLYVTSMDWSVYALDAATGERLWSTRLGGALPSRPVLGDDLLYVSSYDGHVHALDMASGEERWQAPADGAPDWIWGAPALDGDTLYFGDIQGNLYAVDARTGEQKWTKATEVAVQTSPLVVNGTLYVASEIAGQETSSGSLTAYDAATGQQRWSTPTAAPLYATPVVVGDALVVGQQNADALLLGFDPATGQELWRYALPQTTN